MGTLTRRNLPSVFKAVGHFTGEVTLWAGAGTPVGYLLCNGASVLRTDYPGLFNVIGVTYGSVDGTHFTLPNLPNYSGVPFVIKT